MLKTDRRPPPLIGVGVGSKRRESAENRFFRPHCLSPSSLTIYLSLLPEKEGAYINFAIQSKTVEGRFIVKRGGGEFFGIGQLTRLVNYCRVGNMEREVAAVLLAALMVTFNLE